MSRTVILHYHLFKNAGTSLDQILQHNFGAHWRGREFPGGGADNSALVADWIRSEPDGVAFSTHTAFGPPPAIDGVRVISVMFLRDPIARIRSAYRFERGQEADTWGARLAKECDLAGYVDARLANPQDRQCRNFQTHRVASLAPGRGSEMMRALDGLRRLSVLGLVADFDTGVARLADRLRVAYPGFTWRRVRANAAPDTAPPTLEDDRTATALRQANLDDLSLLHAARDYLAGLPAPLSAPSPDPAV